MKQHPLFYVFIALFTSWLASCKQDLGPYKEVNRTYSQTNFDWLDMGSAYHLDVRAGATFQIEVSGASKLEAYDFLTTQADLDVSGASTTRVRVQDALTVKASGASVNSNVSGASTLAQE